MPLALRRESTRYVSEEWYCVNHTVLLCGQQPRLTTPGRLSVVQSAVFLLGRAAVGLDLSVLSSISLDRYITVKLCACV